MHQSLLTKAALLILMSAISIASVASNARSSDRLVDVKLCAPERQVTYSKFGSQTMEIVGLRGSHCLIKFGSEVENPRARDELPIECKIPSGVGEIKIPDAADKSAFGEFSKFCVDIKTGKSISE